MTNGKELVKGWVDVNYKVVYYWSLARFIIFLVIGIIGVLISLFILVFISLLWGFIVLIVSIGFLVLSWVNKKAAAFNKRQGQKGVQQIEERF